MSKNLDPGTTIPDFELPDENGGLHRMSELQGDDVLVLHLSRGEHCPRERQFHRELLRFHEWSAVAFTELVSVLPNQLHDVYRLKSSTGAAWTFLSDGELELQRHFDINEYTDTHHDYAAVPHTLILSPASSSSRSTSATGSWVGRRAISSGRTSATCSAARRPTSIRRRRPHAPRGTCPSRSRSPPPRRWVSGTCPRRAPRPVVTGRGVRLRLRIDEAPLPGSPHGEPRGGSPGGEPRAGSREGRGRWRLSLAMRDQVATHFVPRRAAPRRARDETRSRRPCPLPRPSDDEWSPDGVLRRPVTDDSGRRPTPPPLTFVSVRGHGIGPPPTGGRGCAAAVSPTASPRGA